MFAKFEDLLLRYYEDYQAEALSDDLEIEALKELIPTALAQTVKDVIMFRDMREDTLSAAQIRTIVMERIAGDVMNQVIRMDVDAVEAAEAVLPAEPPGQQEELANSLGYGPTQGAVGKSSAGKGWGGKDQTGKGFGKDQKGKGKDGGQGAGKGERPVGACFH